MFNIRPIKEADYNLIQILFRKTFQIKSGVPPDYVANLCYSEPDGCFVGILDESAVGYICVHTAGSIGYIGNMAVDQSCQGRGYGQALVERAIEYLFPICDVIGLAVEPDLGKNQGFYWKCGFEDTLPSRHVIKHLNADRNSVRIQRNLRFGSDFTLAEHEHLISSVRAWSQELIPGLDFSRDLAHFLKRYPSRILFYVDQGHPIGFLAYEDSFRTDPWGAVKSIENDNLIFQELILGSEVAFEEDRLQFN